MTLLVSPEELAELTGYRQPARQLEELLVQGFWRARRRPVSGDVVLERAHYEAVCAGQGAPVKGRKPPTPTLMSESA